MEEDNRIIIEYEKELYDIFGLLDEKMKENLIKYIYIYVIELLKG